MSTVDQVEMMRAQSDVKVANLNAGAALAKEGVEGLASLMREFNNMLETDAKIEISKRECSRNDAESESRIRGERIQQDIEVDRYLNEKEIHNATLDITHVENAAKVASINDDVQISALQKMLEKQELKEKLLSKGVSELEIDNMLRKKDEEALLSNRVYLESLKLRHEILMMALELEVRKERNINALRDAIRGIELVNGKNYDPNHFFNAFVSSNDEEVSKRIPTGRIRLIQEFKDRIRIEYQDIPLTESERDYVPIEFKMHLLDKDCTDPEILDKIRFEGEDYSLTDLKAYKDISFGSYLVGNVFRYENPDKFHIGPHVKDFLLQAVYKKRGREYLTLRERDELESVYQQLTNGMISRAKDQELRYKMTGEKENFISEGIEYVGDAILDFIGPGLKKAAMTFEDISDTIKNKLS